MQDYLNFISNNPVLFSLFFVILAFIIFHEFRNFTQKFTSISPQEAVFLILDVREKTELEQGSIKNSKHISYSSFKSSIDSIKKYSDKPTIVYCKSGVRSSSISNILTKNNFDQVYSIKGGFEAWVSENLPVVKS